MERQGLRIIFSLGLILLGGVILLNNLGVLPWEITSAQWFWFAVFALGGLGFLVVYFNGRENWWAIIPSFTLLGLAFLLGNFVPETSSVGPAVFLGMIGLSFWVIYLTRSEFWWALIPGGALVTLAFVIIGSDLVSGTLTGSILFLGMALTFLLVYLRPGRGGRMVWALWPAGVLGVLGLVTLLSECNLAQYVFPVALILLGGWIVLRSRRPGLG